LGATVQAVGRRWWGWGAPKAVDWQSGQHGERGSVLLGCAYNSSALRFLQPAQLGLYTTLGTCLLMAGLLLFDARLWASG
jgi:hypothetical protein